MFSCKKSRIWRAYFQNHGFIIQYETLAVDDYLKQTSFFNVFQSTWLKTISQTQQKSILLLIKVLFW